MPRLRSDFWVAAQLRRCATESVDAVLRRRGAAEAGTIFVSVDTLDGKVTLYGPALQASLTGEEEDRVFEPTLVDATGSDVEERMRREIRFDGDLWWVSIDDRNGRCFLTLSPRETPDGAR